MAIVFEERKGPIRVTVDAQGAALRLFRPHERNQIIKASMIAGGRFWIAVFMMKRFTIYSYACLGYTVTAKWRKLKERYMGQAVPFVGFTPDNGGNPPTWHRGQNTEKMSVAAQRGARAEGSASAGGFAIRIYVPFGHIVQADLSAVFRTIPKHELGAIAGEVGRALTHFLAEGEKEGGEPSAPSPARIMTGATSVATRGLSDGGRSTGGSSRKVG
jgi:hypothetical protein